MKKRNKSNIIFNVPDKFLSEEDKKKCKNKDLEKRYRKYLTEGDMYE